MITASPLQAQPADWRRVWREAVTDPLELLRLLDLPQLAARLPAVPSSFAMRVPRGFVQRMRRGDPADPLLRQVLPLDEEDRPVAGFSLDAVGDLHARGTRGVLHKYQGRALLLTTGSCAVHCRYCFRRHFPYGDEVAAAEGWAGPLAWLRDHPDVHEVILSGGDPLSLSTPKLAQLSDGLRALGSIRRVRLHSRLPVVLPERVDGELLAWLASLPWPVVLVLHANHARELDACVADSVAALRSAGVRLYNQSVLLRGVNDTVEALVELSERLSELDIQPYYLHQLDRVAGASHFEVGDDRARDLQRGMRARLPGFLVPLLVRETPGAASKLPL